MEASDCDRFEESTSDEMYSLIENEMYEIVLRGSFPVQNSILRAVWSHRRKTRPDGEIYHYKSRICADESTHKYGVDYNETYYQ